MYYYTLIFRVAMYFYLVRLTFYKINLSKQKQIHDKLLMISTRDFIV